MGRPSKCQPAGVQLLNPDLVPLKTMDTPFQRNRRVPYFPTFEVWNPMLATHPTWQEHPPSRPPSWGGFSQPSHDIERWLRGKSQLHPEVCRTYPRISPWSNVTSRPIQYFWSKDYQRWSCPRHFKQNPIHFMDLFQYKCQWYNLISPHFSRDHLKNPETIQQKLRNHHQRLVNYSITNPN